MTRKEILIVEDEEDIRNLMTRFLEGRGFSVSFASDGREAADLLQTKDYDLLIIDVLLPGEHGMDLIKMKGHNFITPIILVSGVYDEKDIIEKMKDPNVKFFLKKPFDLDELLERVNTAIRDNEI